MNKEVLISSSGIKQAIDDLVDEKEELQQRIDKAIAKIEAMFNNGDENKIIDDLLELDKILGGDNEIN